MEFKNKVAVITGASSGIGKQVAYDLASLGCKVVLIGRDKDKLSKVKADISKLDKEVLAISCDVSNRKHVEEMAKQVIEKMKRVDIVVNAAGFGKWKSFEDSTIEEIEEMMKTNYFGTIYVSKAFLQTLRESDEGHLVNIASMAAFNGIPKFSAYCASKSAVLSFSESLYNEIYGTRFNVTCVCPGAVNTHFFDDPSFGEENKIPKKSITPEEVSKAIIDAIRKKKFLVIVPKKYRAILLAKGLSTKMVHSRIRNMYSED
ncbi:MAG: SDR family NAD(P)-dependent oxidoreductase [Candidatus Nanoarchaeia archaeon]